MLKKFIAIVLFLFSFSALAQTFSISSINGITFQDGGTVDLVNMTSVVGTTNVSLGHVYLSLYDSSGNLVSSSFGTMNIYSSGQVTISQSTCSMCLRSVSGLTVGTAYILSVRISDMGHMSYPSFTYPEKTYSYRVVYGTQGSSATTSTAQTTVTSQTISRAECLFNWAENVYSDLFPAGPSSTTAANYYYRHYPSTGYYLAVGLNTGNVAILGEITQNQIMNIGTLDMYASHAGCQ